MQFNMELYAWGYNYFYQVCDGKNRKSSRRECQESKLQAEAKVAQPKGECEDADGEHILHVLSPHYLPFEEKDLKFVDCGAHFTVVLTSTGTTYIWGLDFATLFQSPEKVIYPFGHRVQIKAISCGFKHTAALSTTNQLFTWGCGFFGRLGHGNEISYGSPRLVEFNSRGTKLPSIEHISCGGSNTAIVTISNDVYMWGFNRYYQCSGNDSLNILWPRLINSKNLGEISNGTLIQKVVCGRHYTALITKDGELYTWGAATFGRLGQPGTRSCIRVVQDPKQVKFFSGKNDDFRIQDIALGDAHCVALTKSGKIVTWGRGDCGQLGHGTNLHCRSPRIIESILDYSFKMVGAGSSHSVALTDTGELFFWGIGYGGGGKNSQAGFDDDFSNNPEILKQDDPSFIAFVACGQTHTAILCDKTKCFIQRDRIKSLVEHMEDTSIEENKYQYREGTKKIFSNCRHNRLEEVEDALNLGFDVNSEDEHGNTLLLLAAQNGLKRMSKLLILHGANVRAQNHKGQSVLHYCFKYSFLDLFHYFVRKGADETLRNVNGNTCYDQ